VQLGEHEPHPVALLAAGLQFRAHTGDHRLLGLRETLEIEGIAVLPA